MVAQRKVMEELDERLAKYHEEKESIAREITRYEGLKEILSVKSQTIERARELDWPEVAEIFERAFDEVGKLIRTRTFEEEKPKKRRGGRPKKVASIEATTTKSS
ncbi:MAG: hypothetical protein M1150_02815 [Patescibacteria group bacterium]|nr:hypothetical protein [Patescibacteria group bacterium]